MHMRSNLGPLHPPNAKACYALIQYQHQRESVAAQCAISCDLVLLAGLLFYVFYESVIGTPRVARRIVVIDPPSESGLEFLCS